MCLCCFFVSSFCRGNEIFKKNKRFGPALTLRKAKIGPVLSFFFILLLGFGFLLLVFLLYSSCCFVFFLFLFLGFGVSSSFFVFLVFLFVCLSFCFLCLDLVGVWVFYLVFVGGGGLNGFWGFRGAFWASCLLGDLWVSSSFVSSSFVFILSLFYLYFFLCPPKTNKKTRNTD